MEFNLEKLKKGYEEKRKTYDLPSFQALNEDFEVEKLQEKETELLLREIRRSMIERSVAYLRFIEMFLNPSNAPMFFFALVKGMDEEKRKNLNDLYLDLGKFEIKSVSLDNNYDERREAEFIKNFYRRWQEIKDKFGKIMKAVEESWDKKSERNQKGYLG